MSEFDKLMAIGDDSLFQNHGTTGSVSLRPDPNAAAIPLAHAIVSDETVMERQSETNDQLVIKRLITISTDATSPRYSGVAQVKRTGIFTVDGIEYQVSDVTRNSFGAAVIEGRRYGVVAVHRRGHEGGDY